MSKHTTMVRWYCEYLYNHRNSEVPTPSTWETDPSVIIPYAANIIFHFPYELWDEDYKPVLTQKILQHYYFREIGEETTAMWQYRIRQTMQEIIPYYNKLYDTTIREYEPLYNRNFTEEYTNKGTSLENKKSDEEVNYTDHQDTEQTLERTVNQDYTNETTRKDTENVTGKTITDQDTTSKNDQTSNSTVKDAKSTTPMNRLIWNDIESGLYASETEWQSTNGTVNDTGEGTLNSTVDNTTDTDFDSTVNDTANTKTTENQTVNTTFDDESNSTRDYTHDIMGQTTLDYVRKISGWDGNSPNEELLKWRDTLINIDMMVIEEFADCFLQVYY